MMESELLIGGILFFTGALAGFIDSIVGGGGLISLPAIMLTNLPIATCLGTNKLSSVFGSGTAMINFAKNGLVNWSFLKWIMPFTLIVSMTGAYIAVYVPPTFLKPVIIALLLVVLVIVVMKKDWGAISKVERMHGWKLVAYMGMAIIIGLYDGIIVAALSYHKDVITKLSCIIVRLPLKGDIVQDRQIAASFNTCGILPKRR